MALERIGIGGVLTFDNREAIVAINATHTSFQRLSRKVDTIPTSMRRVGRAVSNASQDILRASRRINEGISKVSSSLIGLGAALTPLTAVTGLGINQAAKFEQQMSAVGAITRGSSEDMKRLEDRARRAGIETTFSATQAAKAMEYMARSGATTTDIIEGLGGVINAAAAEAIPLSTASNIVAQSTRILGRDWDQAQQTADVLTRTSQLTNTNMIQLGQALRYGGQSARIVGLDLEQTAGIMGQLADAGLTGSMGGTSFANAIRQIANPTDEATQIMRDMNIEMTHGKDGTLDFVGIIDQFIDRINNTPRALDRARQASVLFGARGGRAFAALQQAGTTSTRKLIGELRKASAGIGAAAEAAERRLDNFLGAATLFKSSLEGLAITVFGPMLEQFKEMTGENTKWLNSLIEGIKTIMDAGDNLELRAKAISKLMQSDGKTTTNIMLGVVDAIEAIIGGIKFLRKEAKNLATRMSEMFGPDAVRSITKYATIFVILGSVIGPVVIVLGALIGAISSLGSVIIGVFSGLVGGIFWPLLIVVGALGVAFAYFYESGDTAAETFTRLWDAVKTKATEIYNGPIKDFVTGFSEELPTAIDQAKGSWVAFAEIFRSSIDMMIQQFRGLSDESDITWERAGSTASRIIGWISLTLGAFAAGVVAVFARLTSAITLSLRWISNEWTQWKEGFVRTTWRLVQGLITVFQGGKGLEQILEAIVNYIQEPLKGVTRWIIAINDMLGGTTTTAVRTWARSVRSLPTTAARGAQQRGVGRANIPPPAALGVTAPSIPQDENWENFGVQPIDDSGVTRHVTEIAAEETRRRRKPPRPPNVNLNLTDTRQVNVNNEVCVDGQQLAVASQRHRTEIGERAGFRGVNWNRRLRVEQGAVPTEG
jgi:TP901 family phage tail tape measure protein